MSFIIEEGTRLSESLLWRLQLEAYQKFGPQAWIQKSVPFYPTSTPLIAHNYANVVLGYLRDLIRQQQFNFSDPFYIFDLGAGSGRFSYLFLKYFLDQLKYVSTDPIKIRFIMTDITQKNIFFWKLHPYFKKYIDAGILDFAIYFHSDQKPLEILLSNQEIGEGSLQNPVVLLANYFFDTIPQDFFKISNGNLFEGKFTLSMPEEHKGDAIDPNLISKLSLSHSFSLVADPDNYYKDDQQLNKFLNEYYTELVESCFIFPIGPISTLRYFSKLSSGRLLLVCGDQGMASKEQVKEMQEPKIALHDTFSFPVDYYALWRYFSFCGGSAWLPSLPDTKFVVMSAVMGGPAEKYRETEFAFKSALDAFSPSDYWNITQGIAELEPPMPLENLIAFLKLGHWDPLSAYLFSDAILKQIPEASDEVKRNLVQVIKKLKDAYYPVNMSENEMIQNEFDKWLGML